MTFLPLEHLTRRTNTDPPTLAFDEQMRSHHPLSPHQQSRMRYSVYLVLNASICITTNNQERSLGLVEYPYSIREANYLKLSCSRIKLWSHPRGEVETITALKVQ